MSKQTDITCGTHAVRHALNNVLNETQESVSTDILEMWVQENKKTAKPISEILALAKSIQTNVQFVASKTLDKITHQANHQGVAIRRKISSPNKAMDLTSVLEIDDGTIPLFLVLDGVQDPHNLGACLRTADAVGVRALVLPKDRAVGVNETVRKVASGAAENTPVIYVTNLSRALKEMQDAGVWIIGTADEAENSIFEEDLKSPTALVMGSEGQGLRQNTRSHCDKLVSIPMSGVVESLNVSVAAGICLYEARRQRQFQNK